MSRPRIALFGATGYAGIELTRILADHGGVELAVAASERAVGERARDLAGLQSGAATDELRYLSLDDARRAARECAVALLATPTEVSRELAAELVAANVRVLDLSGAHRIEDASLYASAHGHAPSVSYRAGVYGLPELGRAGIAQARLVANPGCYPTAVALPLAPLLAAGAIAPADLVASCVSGISGAGRQASEAYSLMSLHDNVRAYKLLAHPHTAEIAQTLARAANGNVDVTFIPHLVPLPRGILATITARLARALDDAALTRLLREAYAREPFVEICERADMVDLHRVVGTNRCAIGVVCEARAGGRVVIVSAIDNLIKGAAGQAVQNLNLMLGLAETTGLAQLRRFHP